MDTFLCGEFLCFMEVDIVYCVLQTDKAVCHSGPCVHMHAHGITRTKEDIYSYL